MRVRWIMLAVFACAQPAMAGAVSSGTRPWPEGEVPYRIAPDLLKAAGASGGDCTGWRTWKQAQAFKACKAMDEWRLASDVRFYPSTQRDAILIKDGKGGGTSATMGRLPIGNVVLIEKGATYGAVLHEIRHNAASRVMSYGN